MGASVEVSPSGRPDERDEPAYPYSYFPYQPQPSKKIILCFDGTGNKFLGNESDSNILKIYRMLDRSDRDQFHYYQPGIGTYIANKSISDSSLTSRFKSWYAKAKDSAVGTYFGDHVMAGYQFLMRYHSADDEIYMFGFSRGAYTARFLAEMLDSIGLLSAGNEEMTRFAWKTFRKWQTRQERTELEKKEKKELLDFMCAFRETFSRPIRRIRFLGLFDTVNSVPTFENAWLDRGGRFPYTASSTAEVIRHAVAIDERRAKFRQDLITSQKYTERPHYFNQLYGYHRRHRHRTAGASQATVGGGDEPERGRAPGRRSEALIVPSRFRHQSETSGIRSMSQRRAASAGVEPNAPFNEHLQGADDDDDKEQDVVEVWFPGGHADIGGGWPAGDEGHPALSHVPLVWMVRQAQRAGLNFDEAKLRALNCCPDEYGGAGEHANTGPRIEVDLASPGPDETPAPPEKKSVFHESLAKAAMHGAIHDVLQFNNGMAASSVLSWNIMEYMPFRRMDLQEDGSWKSIVWPLPKGETRDVPESALIHTSVMQRMRADPNYRPGNLICGGGGRGVRRAPEELGMGKWKVAKEKGDPIDECHVRATPAVRQNTGDSIQKLKRVLS